MKTRPLSFALALFSLSVTAALAADAACNGLVPQGRSLVCSGFEPNWAIELRCDGELSSNFTDAFSGTITVQQGSVVVTSKNPWKIETSDPVSGTIAYRAAGCQDESDRAYDYTFTPTAAPGLSAPFHPMCCRLE